MQLCQSVAIMTRVGPGAFSSVSFRRKQNVNSQFASTHGQASQVLTLGTKRHVPQSFEGHAIQVYKALSTSSECSLVL